MDDQTISIACIDNSPVCLSGIENYFGRDQGEVKPVILSGYSDEVHASIAILQPEVLVLDPVFKNEWALDVVHKFRTEYPEIPMVIFSAIQSEIFSKSCLTAGVYSVTHKSKPLGVLESEIIKASCLGVKESKLTPFFDSDGRDLLIKVTNREKDIMRLLIEGLNNRQIAEKEFISHHTVDFHRRRLFRKLGVSNIASLVREGCILFGL